MTAEELEFQISQYVDGTLSPPQRQVVEALLQSDSSARKILGDYQQLDFALMQHEWTPPLHWDRVAQNISNAIEEATLPAVVGRIGFFQQKWRVAAAVMVTAMVGLVAHHVIHAHPSDVPMEVAGSSVVVGPGAEVAQGAPVEEISVGPSPALAMHNADWRYGEGVVGRGSSNVVLLDALATPGETKSRAQ